jgi:hypothetical protein
MKPFVERLIPLVRGRKTTPLRLRVFAPVADGLAWACNVELSIRGKVVIGPITLYGADSVQALLCAMSIAVLRIEVMMLTTKSTADGESIDDLRKLRPVHVLPRAFAAPAKRRVAARR